MRYGLPRDVHFCKRCVISNQRPNSAVEFKHTRDTRKATIAFDEEGVCDACRFAEQKQGTIDWKRARGRAARAVRPLPQQRRALRLPRAGLRRQGQLLRRAHAQVQVRHAPADGDLGAAHLHRVGLAELPGLDARRLRQLPVHAERPRAPAADAARRREPVPSVPALHPRPEEPGAEDGVAARHPAGVLRRERGGVRQPDRRHATAPGATGPTSPRRTSREIFLGGTSVREPERATSA